MKAIKYLLPIFLFFILLASNVSADGFIHVYDEDMWQIHNERQQLCAINYQDGYQNMILSIDVDELHGEKAVWIFPVPAEPEETVIDIIKGFPNLHGYDIQERVDDEIKTAFSLMRLTQIYSFPYEAFTRYRFYGLGKGRFMAMAEGVEPSVQVHEHIEEMGLVTELVTAKDGTAFWNWLALKELELPEDAKAILDEYIGEEYSFVISWISDIEEFKKNQSPYERHYEEYHYRTNILAVYLKFPTDRIYYPLKPTSVYGSLRVPALIYVMDFVKPEFYSSIKQDADVTYYAQESYYPDNELEEFFNTNEKIGNFRYTRIKLNPPSKYLKDDLWIDKGAPAGISIANCIIQHTFWFGLLFFIICSLLASFISGMIFFRKDNVSKFKLALWGLWNLTTLIGFIIATVFLKTRQIDPKLARELKQKGLRVAARDLRKVLFVIVFSLLFIGLTFVMQYLMSALF